MPRTVATTNLTGLLAALGAGAVLAACGGDDVEETEPDTETTAIEAEEADEPVMEELPSVVTEEPNITPTEDPGPITGLDVLGTYEDSELGGMEVDLEDLTVSDVYNEDAFAISAGGRTIPVLIGENTRRTGTDALEQGQAVSLQGRIFTDETGTPPAFRDLPEGVSFYIEADTLTFGESQ